MINFLNVQIQGFGSFIQPYDFKLNRHGLNIIRGKVGSGKTTIPSAITWCLYGSSLKKKASVETWEHLRQSDYPGTKVILEFSKGNSLYQIIRCSNYKGKVYGIKGGNNLFIRKDNELFHESRNKADKQDFINSLIGYSFDLFINSIVFGQRMKKIIEETGPVKKKIFEEAFEVTFIEEARLTVKDRHSKTVALITKYNFENSTLLEKQKDLQEDLVDALEFEKEFKKNKKLRIAKIKEKISTLQKEKALLVQQRADINFIDINALVEKDKALNKDITNARINNVKLEALLREIQLLEDEETELSQKAHAPIKLCPTCGGELSFKKSQQLTKKREERLKELDKIITEKRDIQFRTPKVDLKPLEKLITDNRTLIEEGRVKKALLIDKEKQLNKLEGEIKTLASELLSIKKEELRVKSSIYAEKLEINTKKLDILQTELNRLNEEKQLDNWLISDPLSNSGLKAYIFDSLLNQVNSYLKEYSKILGFRVEFGIDLVSNKKDFYQLIYKDDTTIMYEDLSGGQKQLVDTSVALAIHSVISNIRPINILFMDEPFEGLDDETVEIVAELIDYKCKKQCLYLITHHSSFNPINAKKISMKLSPEGHTLVS